MVVCEPPKKRGTWDPHGLDGWYLGRSPDHYHCHRVYVPKMRAECITQMVKFFPHKGRYPQTSAKHVAVDLALRLIQDLRNPAPEAPFAASKKHTADALEKLT